MALGLGDLFEGQAERQAEHDRSRWGMTKWEYKRGRAEAMGIVLLIAVVALLLMRTCAIAQIGGGSIVFDPQMYARQLLQLNQEIQQVTTLGQQLQNMVKNTTGGNAGIWASSLPFLNSLGSLIQQQQGLSYSYAELAQEFEQLYPGYTVQNSALTLQQSVNVNLNTLNGALQDAQAQAQEWQTEQTTLSTLELKNGTAIGNLQVAQTGNEIALAQVQQLQSLRELAMALLNSENVNSANGVNAQSASQQTAATILGTPAQISPW
jgi:type IV secretion system protein TrbJ